MYHKLENTRLFNIAIILLSLVLHGVVILIFFMIPPQKRTPYERKTFNVVELQRGMPDVVKPQPEVKKAAPQKTKTIEPQKQPPQQIPVQPQVPVETKAPEVITSDNAQNDQTAVSVPQGTSHPEPGPVSQTPSQQTSQPSSQQGTVFGTVDAGVTGLIPVKLYAPKPAYPPIAQDLGITGTVIAILSIDENGKVTDVLIKSAPHKSMSDEVKRTLLTWKFKPFIYKGERVIVKKFIQEIEYNEQ
jgi:periplasmic protein TonB